MTQLLSPRAFQRICSEFFHYFIMAYGSFSRRAAVAAEKTKLESPYQQNINECIQ